MLYSKFILLWMLGCCICAATAKMEFPGLRAIYNYLRGEKKSIANMTLEEIGISSGQCYYDFLEFITHKDRTHCALGDDIIMHLKEEYEREEVRKPPIMVKCLQPDPAMNSTEPTLIMLNSIQDFLNLLKPVGNATKRHEPGSCTIVHFYADDSMPCARVAALVNLLPFQFPTLRIAAIDAIKFKSFNTEFGILGLPSLLLLHQGRPVVKYQTEDNYLTFITKHTGIKSLELTTEQISAVTGPLPLEPVQRHNYVLWLAWAFIWAVVIYFFFNSACCQQIIEMVKRNWRESEEQLEH